MIEKFVGNDKTRKQMQVRRKKMECRTQQKKSVWDRIELH